MWTLLIVSALLAWLLALAIQVRQETYRFDSDWLEDKLSPFAWYRTWDRNQITKLVAEHNRRVDAHRAKSMM